MRFRGLDAGALARAVRGARAGCLAALAIAPAAGADESHYVDASVAVEGRLLEARFIDVDLDGELDLVLAVRTAPGARELRVHALNADSVARAPKHTIRVLEDVVAWTFADVREEPGRELVMLTRGGAFAMSPGVAQLRGNVRRLLDAPLLFDVPDPLALPYWAYVLPAKGGEQLLLPDRSGFSIYGPGESAEDPWRPLATWPAGGGEAAIDPEDTDRRRRELEEDRRNSEARFEVTLGDNVRPFMGEASTTTLVSEGRTMRAPALVDVDGDGRLDLLLLLEAKLLVHIATADGIPAKPTRVEELPGYLRRNDRPASLRLVDVDGDGRLDLLGIWNEEIDSFENVEWRLFVMRSSKDRTFPAEPDQVLRFEAAQLRIDVANVDADDTPDLVVRSFTLPGKIEAATGLRFEHSHLVYFGGRNGFERRPTVRHSRTYDEEGVSDVLANRRMTMDCSGDGIADLVEVGISGNVAIKRLRKSSGLFSGTTWSLDDAPWKSYSSRGSILSLEVRDLNEDGLGDVVSRAENGLTLLLSRKGGKR